MSSPFELLPEDDGLHSLLQPPAPAYSAATVRRALVVWLHCGQQNELRQVCNYFHRLEAMEATLTIEQRVSSRLHEFHMLSANPPTSSFLIEHFPTLYRHTNNSKINVKELQEIQTQMYEGCVFKLEGYYDLKVRKGVTHQEMVLTSHLIRKFSKNYSKPLRNVFLEFQDFVKKTRTSNSVANLVTCIKRRYLKDDILLWHNMPKTFDFLEDDNETVDEDYVSADEEDLSTIDDVSVNEIGIVGNSESPVDLAEDHAFNADKGANQIKILINESRRKDLLNMIPNCQNVLSAKLSKMQQAKPDGGSL